MSKTVELLMEKIKQGQMVRGTYIRRARANDNGAKFEELIVRTENGNEYYTRSEQVCDGFLNLVNYQGYFINSESVPDGCLYESMASWQPA